MRVIIKDNPIDISYEAAELIVKQINKSREGNDCWIDETYTMCEWLGVYYILYHWKVTGWDNREEVRVVSEPTRNKEEANKQWGYLIKENL